MKRLLFSFLLLATSVSVLAQKLDKAKELLKDKKLSEAKTEIDNFLAQEKNQKNSEAWYVKSKVYLAISNDPTLKATTPAARETSFEAVKKYIDLEGQVKEPEKRYLIMTVENRAPLVDLYSGYSKDGATYYNANNFNDALVNFKSSLEIFDLLSKHGWTPLTLDTITTLYAGISAEKATKLDEAAIYYGKIAEAKAKSEGYVEIYKWLADHYKQKGDLAMASKYVDLGREVYPNDMFWPGFELDMLREKGSTDSLFAKYEEVIKRYPDSPLFVHNYAVELYKAGYNPDLSKRPANSKALIDKASENIRKSLALKSDYPSANLVMGQLLYNQAIDINNENKAIRPPAGGRLKPEELKKKEQLRAEMNKKYDEAIPYFENVDKALGSQGKLKMEDKSYLKDTYDLLITIYEQKGNKEKVAEYTDKFNNVERKH